MARTSKALGVRLTFAFTKAALTDYLTREKASEKGRLRPLYDYLASLDYQSLFVLALALQEWSMTGQSGDNVLTTAASTFKADIKDIMTAVQEELLDRFIIRRLLPKKK